MTTSAATQKHAEAFRTISEVADALKLPQHVLRFWETRFVQIKPMKRAGGRRFYRPQDVELVSAIRQLLYGDGYTIKGVQRILREQGPRAVAALAARQKTEGSAPAGASLGAAAEALRVVAGRDDLEASEDSEAVSAVDHLRTALAHLAECRRILTESVPG